MTGKLYIGSSIDVPLRLKGHQYDLNRGKHPNRHLQFAWQKDGPDAFVFEVVEVTADLEVREAFWIRSHERSTLYNLKLHDTNRWFIDPEICKEGARKRTGRKASDETRRKISESHKKYIWTVEHRENNRLARLGTKRTPEQNEANRQRQLARPPISETTRQKLRDNMLRVWQLRSAGVLPRPPRKFK